MVSASSSIFQFCSSGKDNDKTEIFLFSLCGVSGAPSGHYEYCSSTSDRDRDGSRSRRDHRPSPITPTASTLKISPPPLSPTHPSSLRLLGARLCSAPARALLPCSLCRCVIGSEPASLPSHPADVCCLLPAPSAPRDPLTKPARSRSARRPARTQPPARAATARAAAAASAAAAPERITT